ncbi:MAG: hypothetical protein WCJ45_01780 [bacterium]
MLFAGDVFGFVIVIVGAVVSYIISSLTDVDRLPRLSLYLTYTVFVQSHVPHHMILKLLVVAYVSSVVHVELSQLNCIPDTQFVSVDDKVNVAFEPLVAVAHPLIEMVFELGGVLSIVKVESEVSSAAPNHNSYQATIILIV